MGHEKVFVDDHLAVLKQGLARSLSHQKIISKLKHVHLERNLAPYSPLRDFPEEFPERDVLGNDNGVFIAFVVRLGTSPHRVPEVEGDSHWICYLGKVETSN